MSKDGSSLILNFYTMLPSTNLRTDIVLVKDSDWKIKRIPVTKQQYHSIQQEKQDWNRSTLLAITDADTGEKLFHGELWDIKGFEDIKHKDTSNLKWICDYWTRHTMGEECKCIKAFKISPMTFRIKANQLFWWKHTESEVLESGRIRTREHFGQVYPWDLTRDQKLLIINS